MRRISEQSQNYECRVIPVQDVDRWARWDWETLCDGVVIATGWHKRLRKAEKAAERAAMQHKMRRAMQERQAQNAEVAAHGKTWRPWL